MLRLPLIRPQDFRELVVYFWLGSETTLDLAEITYAMVVYD